MSVSKVLQNESDGQAGHSLLEKWMMLQAIIADNDLPASATKIAARLLDHLNGKSGECFPSNQTLAAAAGIHPNCARTSVQALEGRDWITVRRQAGKSNTFSFNWSRIQATADPLQKMDPYKKVEGTPPEICRGTPPEICTLTLEVEPKKEPKKKILPQNEFDTFWTVFPRNVEKKAAVVAYAKARKTTSAEVILAGTQRYAAARQNEDPKFTKHPATWLNKGCWDDEPAPSPTPMFRGDGQFNGGGAYQSKYTDADRYRFRQDRAIEHQRALDALNASIQRGTPPMKDVTPQNGVGTKFLSLSS